MNDKRLSRIEKQIAKLSQEAERLRASSKGKVIGEILALMNANGVTVDEVKEAAAAAKPARKARGAKAASKVKPKYRSPADASLTWTGRGRKPKWVQEWLDAGNALEALLIA